MADALAPYLAALWMAESDPAVQHVIGLLGGEPVVSEFQIGAPAHRDRHLCFAGGGEILLRDGVVCALFFHVQPTETAPNGFPSLGAVIPGLGSRATPQDVESALGEPIRFSWSPTSAGYAVGAGIVAVSYGAKSAKGERYLELVRLSAEDASTRWVPVHERCGTCSDLLVRSDAPGSGGVDLAATAAALVSGVEAGTLTPVRGWVQPADMHPLRASGLMERIEVRVRCATCGFMICLTVGPGAEPTFEYVTGSLADKQERIPIPPVELWADPERIARDRQGLRVIDHGPSAWFLLRDGDELHLDARYSHSGLIDTSALIRLDADEQRSYRDGGHAYISRLQDQIHYSAPFQESSPYFRRDQYRGPDRKALRAAVSDAIGIWKQDALWWDRAEDPRDP